MALTGGKVTLDVRGHTLQRGQADNSISARTREGKSTAARTYCNRRALREVPSDARSVTLGVPMVTDLGVPPVPLALVLSSEAAAATFCRWLSAPTYVKLRVPVGTRS